MRFFGRGLAGVYVILPVKGNIQLSQCKKSARDTLAQSFESSQLFASIENNSSPSFCKSRSMISHRLSLMTALIPSVARLYWSPDICARYDEWAQEEANRDAQCWRGRDEVDYAENRGNLKMYGIPMIENVSSLLTKKLCTLYRNCSSLSTRKLFNVIMLK